MGIHKKILGTVYIVWGVCSALFYFIGVIFIADFLPIIINEHKIIAFSKILPFVMGAIVLPVSVLSIIGGIGLLNNKSWALTLLFIIGCLLLLCYPLGTVVGIYTMLVFYDEYRKKDQPSADSSN